jgi:ABC-type nickel/cobalt efflux system permease component RcnA
MLLFAIAAQRLWLGLPLLLAFSAGLAAVLVAVGIAVVRARQMLLAREDGDVRLGRWDPWLERLGKWLPLISAVAIVGLGLWLCLESARSAGV